MLHDFPGSEDYEEGASPVRELPLSEQVEYWKERARRAESHFLVQTPDERDDADWWKDRERWENEGGSSST